MVQLTYAYRITYGQYFAYLYSIVTSLLSYTETSKPTCRPLPALIVATNYLCNTTPFCTYLRETRTARQCATYLDCSAADTVSGQCRLTEDSDTSD